MEPTTIIVDRPLKREYALKVIGKLPVEDGEVWDIRIGKYIARRTLQQNARLHLIFQKVALETGSDIDSVKLGYKAMFLAGKETEFHGRKIIVYPQTSKMNKQELNSFMDQVETHAITEFGVILEHEN
jgi:hypothetical protein